MALTDCTCRLLCASAAGFCVDVAAGSASDAAAVQTYTVNSTLAQLWHLMARTTTTWQLLSVLSGKSLDVINGSLTSGTRLQQWDDNDTTAQTWTLAATGSTVTYDSTGYASYYIQPSGSSLYVGGVSGTTPANGNRLCLVSTTTLAIPVIVIPTVGALPDGTYEIRSGLDQSVCVDVPSASTAQGTQLELWSENDTDAQRFVARTDPQTGLTRLTNVGSALCMNARGAGTADGTPVQQWADDASGACRWLATKSSYLMHNGVTVAGYNLRSDVASSGPMLDAAAGSTQLGTKLDLYASNGTLAQRWEARPANAYGSTLPVPSSMGLGTSVGSALGTSVAANGSKTWYPYWSCDGSGYLVRYRTRKRLVSGTWADWGPWLDIVNGSAANGGWGDVWTTMLSAVDSSGAVSSQAARKWSPNGVSTTLDGTTYDEAELEVQACRTDASYGSSGAFAAGPVGDATFGLVWSPTLTIGSLAWSPDGLRLAYSLDFAHGGNSMTITIDGLVDSYTVTDLESSGTITIPQSSLSAIPTSGESVTVEASITTRDTTVTRSVAATVSYQAGHGETLAPTVTTEASGTSLLVALGSHATTGVWMAVTWPDRTLYVECPETSTAGTYRACPPLNTGYRLFALAVDDESWDTWEADGPLLSARLAVWNWADDLSEAAALMCDMTHGWDITADTVTDTPNGGEFEATWFGDGYTSAITASGTLVEGSALGSDFESFFRLSRAHTAVYRTPWGGWHRVAVTKVSPVHSLADYGTVSVTMGECDPT